MLPLLLFITLFTSVYTLTLPLLTSAAISANTTLEHSTPAVNLTPRGSVTHGCNGAVKLYGGTKYSGKCFSWGSPEEVLHSKDDAECVTFPSDWLYSFRVDMGRKRPLTPWKCSFYRYADCTGWEGVAVRDRPNFGAENKKHSAFKCYACTDC